jgi:hypothetical protein
MRNAVKSGQAAAVYGAFSRPRDCSVLVLVPMSLVTGAQMLAAALPGFQRCTGVVFAGRDAKAQLGRHALGALFPPQEAKEMDKNGTRPPTRAAAPGNAAPSAPQP